MADLIDVEVAYALPDTQCLLHLTVEEGTTALQAVKLSGIASRFAEIDIDSAPMGVFSQVIDPASYVLNAWDRVEIYRPLVFDPNDLRLQRASKNVVRNGGRAANSRMCLIVWEQNFFAM